MIGFARGIPGVRGGGRLFDLLLGGQFAGH